MVARQIGWWMVSRMADGESDGEWSHVIHPEILLLEPDSSLSTEPEKLLACNMM
jgi:hypothetical protein